MSESVDTADWVDVCLVFRAASRPESALTNPETRLEVSMPDPTPLRLLVSAMILSGMNGRFPASLSSFLRISSNFSHKSRTGRRRFRQRPETYLSARRYQ